MVPTTPCVKRRKGWLRKHKTDGNSTTGALSHGAGISNSAREISMYLKALLLTVLLGILLYSLCESKSHHRRKKLDGKRASNAQEAVDLDAEGSATMDESGCLPRVSIARICKREAFYVNLTDLLGVEVISPPGLVDIGVCVGECRPEVIGKDRQLPPYNNLFRTRAVIREEKRGQGFCVPDVLSSLPYYARESQCGVHAVQHLADTVVQRCSCVL